MRVHPDIPIAEMAEVVRRELAEYDSERQAAWARRAASWYNWREVGRRLAENIERLRQSYPLEAPL